MFLRMVLSLSVVAIKAVHIPEPLRGVKDSLKYLYFSERSL